MRLCRIEFAAEEPDLPKDEEAYIELDFVLSSS